MATKNGKEGGVVGRLAGKGEEALRGFVDELGKNPRVTDAMGKATNAKGRLDGASRSMLSQVGIGAAEELRDLREHVDQLEKRIAKLEDAAGIKSTAKRAETKKTPSAKRSTKSASAGSRKKAEQSASPAAGRAIGGGAARGSGT
ncbi:MAG TPA: hypothetical protein VH306_00130 [Gaiellaceae bacterium]|jgi:polyhydroxyalkanoate synthesis regulator phasin